MGVERVDYSTEDDYQSALQDEEWAHQQQQEQSQEPDVVPCYKCKSQMYQEGIEPESNICSKCGQHRWSGWPGAWCLDCGVECMLELALGCNDCRVKCGSEDKFEGYICDKHIQKLCPESGSKRYDPYEQMKRKNKMKKSRQEVIEDEIRIASPNDPMVFYLLSWGDRGNYYITNEKEESMSTTHSKLFNLIDGFFKKEL